MCVSLEIALKQGLDRVFIPLQFVYQLLTILESVSACETISSVCQETMRCRNKNMIMTIDWKQRLEQLTNEYEETTKRLKLEFI